MTSRPTITDAQRRARLARRHHLGRTAGGPDDAARAVVAVHSSDPATPYLGMWARVPRFATEDLDRSLHEARTLWRLHAMRRTLFVVPAGEAAVFHGAAGRDVAAKERRRLERWLAAEIDPARVTARLSAAQERVLEVLGGGEELRTQELARAVPELGTEITLGWGKWTARVPHASRLLNIMAMEGLLVRTRAAGTWRSSQYRWAAAASWFGAPLRPMDAGEARAELARRYLARHGPATLVDVRWWTGWTARQATAALGDVAAVPVALEDGREAFVLPDDTDPGEPAPSHVAFLPGLDPSPMGWKERGWYLGALAGSLFDRNGNVGPTVWAHGRVVGGWSQRSDGEVVFRVLTGVGSETRARLRHEAAALTEWLDGVVVSTRFPTPLERELSG